MDTITPGASREKLIFRTAKLVWYAFSLLQFILVLRFVLKLLQANANAGFTKFIYEISSIFVGPFRSVFPTPVVDGSIVEWSTLLAVLVYSAVAMGLIKLISLARTVTHEEAKEKLDREEV